MRTHASAAAGLLLITTFSGSVTAAEQQYSCKGQMIAPSGEPQEAVNVNLDLGSRNKTTIEISDGKPLNVHVISNNKLQLKFKTRQFVGEYFYYSGDLFLIYKTEKLARLTCSRR